MGLCLKGDLCGTMKFWDGWKYHYFAFPFTTQHRLFQQDNGW
jgi:hypothetical protein